MLRRPVTVLGALALGVGTLTACGNPGSPQQAPSTAQIERALKDRAAAVLARSAERFLAGVDAERSTSAFRAEQRTVIANLTVLPVRSWGYTVDAAVTDRTAIRASSERYGAPTTIVRVTLSYALDRVDPEPDRHDQWLTFVRRDGRTLLAGDDDLAEAGGQSWRGPWEFGPLSSVRSVHALVLGQAGTDARLHELAADVDAAVPAVDAVWGPRWPRQIAVLVPSSSAELDALAGPSSAAAEVAAIAINSGTDPLSGAVRGQRLVVKPDALAGLSAVGRRIVITHELTHIATAAATSPSTPRWLVEGLAEYVANRGSGQPVHDAAAELRADVAGGRLPARLPPDADFTPDSGRAAQAYQESWLACRLIADRVGPAGLVRLYRMVATAIEPADAATSDALREVLHESVPQFTARWRAYLVEQLG
jgi:hypothetical protein